MGKKDKKRKSSVSRTRSRRRDKKEKKKAEKKKGAKEERRRRKDERSESSSSKGKGKAKESESSEVEREPVKPKETPVEPVASVAMALDVPLIVSGCQNPTISEIVKGTYFRHGSNHGKPVYKKKQEEVTDDDDLDVLIYFWDDRDGEENCGWWFSPSVGGEMVWAYHPSRKATTPPPAEWNVPHDGPIDKSFSVTAAPELAKKAEEKAEEKDDDDEDEEEEEEEEEEDEEVAKPKEEAKVPVKEPELDLTGLSPEERELKIQEAEDRRIMEQLKQRELERKKKAEELRLKKEQEQKALEAEEKKKKKQKDKEQKKKDKEEKKRREEEERQQREKAEEERRRREEDERRRKREEDDNRRKKEEEEEKLRREEEERERRRKEEEREREEKERRRKREEEEREREERERRRKREEEEREREERERRRKREEEEREERERRRKRDEEREREEREKRRKREEEERRREEEEEKRRKKLKEEEDKRRKEEEERRREEEEKRRKEEEERRRKREAEEEEERKRRKLQEEKERKEEEERERIRLEELRVKEQQIREVVAELEKLLVKAEEEATKARQVTENLYQLVNQMNSPNSAPRESLAASFPPRAEEALRSAKAASRLGHVAQSACETAWKSLEQNWMQISQVETLRNEVAHFVQRSEQRMQQAQMVAAQAVKMASESMERICNTAAPAICDRKNGDIFRRYDQDEDGMLSASEVTTFARLEYGFALPKDNLDRILSHLGHLGQAEKTEKTDHVAAVEPKRFHQLRTAVGIARFEVRAKKVKEAKAEKAEKAEGTAAIPGAAEEEKLLVEFQNHLKQRQNGIASEMEKIAWKDLESKIAEVESTSASFVKAAADSVSQDELQRFEATFDAALQAARSALPGFVNQLRSLHHEALQVSMKAEEKKPKETKETEKTEKTETQEDMKAEKPEEKTEKENEAPKTEGQDEPKEKDELKVLKEKLRGLSLRLAKLEARLVLSERKASEGRKVTARILAHKVEEVRLEVAMKLRQCIEQLGGKAVDLFQIIAKGEDVASVEEAQVFLKENNCEMEMEKLSKAFAACKSTPQDGSAGPVKVTREEFTRIIRVCYEVTKEVALTETVALGPAMRNLQVGEVLEVQAGPRADPSSEGLQRIHARAQLDGALGWVTLSSSEGEYLVKKPNPTS